MDKDIVKHAPSILAADFARLVQQVSRCGYGTAPRRCGPIQPNVGQWLWRGRKWSDKRWYHPIYRDFFSLGMATRHEPILIRKPAALTCRSMNVAWSTRIEIGVQIRLWNYVAFSRE